LQNYPQLQFKLCLQPAIRARAAISVMRWLQLRFDFDSTAIRPRYDHSTTNVTCVWAAVMH